MGDFAFVVIRLRTSKIGGGEGLAGPMLSAVSLFELIIIEDRCHYM